MSGRIIKGRGNVDFLPEKQIHSQFNIIDVFWFQCRIGNFKSITHFTSPAEIIQVRGAEALRDAAVEPEFLGRVDGVRAIPAVEEAVTTSALGRAALLAVARSPPCPAGRSPGSPGRRPGLLACHRHAQPLLGGDQVIRVLRVLAEVDLHPLDPAGEDAGCGVVVVADR